MPTTHTAFAITETTGGESFTYVRGDGPTLLADHLDATASVTYALESVIDDLDAGRMPDEATQTFLALHIVPEDGAL